MAWNGWFSYGGTEIINVTRTETYMKNAGLWWFKPVFKNDDLPLMLGDGDHYRTPLIDDAPWVDPDVQESLGFYGVYPLDVTGIEDSTRQSTVTESLGDGGAVGRIRHATKTLVFNALVLAETERSADYGVRWLKQALLGGACGGNSGILCNGDALCYLSAGPELEERSETQGALAILDGGLFAPKFTPIGVTDGGDPDDPETLEVDGGGVYDTSTDSLGGGTAEGHIPVDLQVDLPDMDGGGVSSAGTLLYDGGSPRTTGGLIDSDIFPFNAAEVSQVSPEDCLVPLERSLRKVLFNSGPTVVSKRETSDGCNVWNVEFSAVVGNPWELSGEVPIIEGFLDPAIEVPWVGGIQPEGGIIDLDGYIHSETACAVPVFEPLYDPLAPAILPPPAPPSVPLANYTPPSNWRRRQFTIPKQFIPTWSEAVPKVEVHAGADDLRNLRLRFYADPGGMGSIIDDPCAYCGDILVSYVPANHTMVLDGAEQSVYVISPGGTQRRADSLVFASDGTPFEWPALACGFGYVVTVDLPQTQTPPVMDLSLFSRAV